MMIELFKNANEMLDMWNEKLALMGFEDGLIYEPVTTFYETVDADLAEFLFMPPQEFMEFKFQRAMHPYCRRMMKLFDFEVPRRENFDIEKMSMKDYGEMFNMHNDKFDHDSGFDLQTWYRMLQDCNWLYIDFFNQDEFDEKDFFENKLENGYGFDRTFDIKMEDLEGELFDLFGITDEQKEAIVADPVEFFEDFAEMNGYGMMGKRPLCCKFDFLFSTSCLTIKILKAGRFEKLRGFTRIYSFPTRGSVSLSCATTPNPSCFSKS